MAFNPRSAYAIYRREMARAFRTAFQSILSPVLTTSLYFVVFGSVIGARMEPIGGVPYGKHGPFHGDKWHRHCAG
ncbi:MAG: hypothetical protein ACKO1N_10125, partial [Erythrobacter sp.]